MRILLDAWVPRPLRRELAGHDVRTVVEMGWAGKRHGELRQLLRTATVAVFLTTDQNFREQQNWRGSPLAVVVVVAPTKRLDALVSLRPQVRTVLAAIQPRAVVEGQASSLHGHIEAVPGRARESREEALGSRCWS